MYREIFEEVLQLLREDPGVVQNEVLDEGLCLLSRFLTLQEMRGKISFESISSMLMRACDSLPGELCPAPSHYQITCFPYWRYLSVG